MRRRAESRLLLSCAFVALVGVPLVVIGAFVFAGFLLQHMTGMPVGWFVVAVGATPLACAHGLLGSVRGTVPPPLGVALAPADEPDLWAVVREAARRTGSAEPEELLLVLGDAVVPRGGPGATLLVGLPWLDAPTATLELACARALAAAQAGAGSRAEQRLARVCAREAWNDSRWGRWTWRCTRPAGWFLRAATDGHHGAADEACVRAYGRPALEVLAEGDAAQADFRAWFHHDVAPCLLAGFLPPVLERWEDFGALPDTVPVKTRASIGELERAVVLAVEPDLGILVDLPWAAVGNAVWLPELRAAAGTSRTDIPPFALSDLAVAARAVFETSGFSHDVLTDLDVAIAVALTDAGWRLDAPPGGALAVTDEHVWIEVHGLSRASLQASWDDEDWQLGAALAGVADVEVTRPQPAAAVDEPWATATVVPAGPPVTLRLARPAGRVPRMLAGGLLTALFLGFAIFFLASIPTAPSPLAVVLLALMGGGCGVAALRGGVGRLRALWATGTVTVRPDAIEIEHRGLLSAPFEIARSATRLVLVDDGRQSRDVRLLLGDDDPRLASLTAAGGDWLWVRDEPTEVPLLAVGQQAPTLALLFEEPIPGPRVHRARLHGPLEGEALRGILLPVADPQAAREALASWGLTRAAGARPTGFAAVAASEARTPEPAVFALEPRAALVRRKQLRRAWLCLGVGFLAPPIAFFAFATGSRLREEDGGGHLGLIVGSGAVVAARIGLAVTGVF